MRSFSAAFDLRRIDPKLWVTNDDDCQEVEDLLVGLRRLISVQQERLLARRDPFERKASKLIEHPRPFDRRLVPGIRLFAFAFEPIAEIGE